jgi:hypothetical protein
MAFGTKMPLMVERRAYYEQKSLWRTIKIPMVTLTRWLDLKKTGVFCQALHNWLDLAFIVFL